MQATNSPQQNQTKMTFHEQLDGLVSTAALTYGTLSRIVGSLNPVEDEVGGDRAVYPSLCNDSLQGKIDTLRRILNDVSRKTDELECQVGYHPTSAKLQAAGR
jgi:hypothetical protein